MFAEFNMEMMLTYLSQYGIGFLFLIVFLEYLNLPGLPAGIIMPATGILIAQEQTHFFKAIFISVLAGLLGSLVLYAVGYFIGKPLIDKLCLKYKKVDKSISKIREYVERYGNKGVLFTRLIPIARTIVSLVAGTSRMRIIPFLLYSSLGILIWNFVFIYLGYAFGHIFLNN